ncbi:hypothetical protein STEG23_019706, partial [Scotinomys teguina]
ERSKNFRWFQESGLAFPLPGLSYPKAKLHILVTRFFSSCPAQSHHQEQNYLIRFVAIVNNSKASCLSFFPFNLQFGNVFGKGKKGKSQVKTCGKKQKQKKPEPDILSPAAMMNLYYIAHNAADCLYFRGYPWPGATKGERGKNRI